MRKLLLLFFLFFLASFSSAEDRLYTNEDLNNYRGSNGYAPKVNEFAPSSSVSSSSAAVDDRAYELDRTRREALRKVEKRIEELEFKLNSSLLKPGERSSMTGELQGLYRDRMTLTSK